MKLPRPCILETLLVMSWLLAIASYSSPLRAQAQTKIRTKVNPKDGLTYVWISPGTFQMGCSPNDPE